MAGIFEKGGGLLALARPPEWSKTFGNMVIAALIAVAFQPLDWLLFLAGFIAVGPLLWGGLYALNDWVDWEGDKFHAVKKARPIPSGAVTPDEALVFSLSLIFFSFLVALALQNLLLVFCMVAMLINQTLYTMPPFNLKKVPVLDLVSGSLVNPFFRFFSGWVLFQQNFNAPILIVVFVLGLQFGGYALYRLSGKELEKKLGYKSSIVVFGEKNIRLLAYAGIVLGVGAFIWTTVVGVLPLRFILLALASALLLPLYWNAMKDPKKMDMPFVYKLIYAHYILFIAGFILLSYL